MIENERVSDTQPERWALDHYRETVEAWKRADNDMRLAEDAFTAEYGTPEHQAQHLATIVARSQAETLKQEATLSALHILVGPGLADLINTAWGCAEMHAGRGPYEASTAEEVLEGRSALAEALFRSGKRPGRLAGALVVAGEQVSRGASLFGARRVIVRGRCD